MQAVAVASARRPSSRFGILLATAGFAWFLVALDNPGVGSGVAFTVGLLSYAACPPLVAHAALAYPGGRLTSPLERAALMVAYGATVVLLGVASALVFDSARQGCSQCPQNHLAVTSDPGLLAALQRDGVRLGLLWAVALAGLAAWRVLRSSSAARLVKAPVLLAAVVYLGLVAADYAHSLGRGFLSNDDAEKRLWAGQAAALVALASGAGRLDTAATELRAALEDLRELGRGIYPAVLVDEGLAAALDSLAEEGRVPTVVGAVPPERLAPPVEAAAYFLVAEVLNRSRARRVAVLRRAVRRTAGRRDRRHRRPRGRPRRSRGPHRRARRRADCRAFSGRPPGGSRGGPMRVVIADDEMLLREGLARLLTDAASRRSTRGSDGGARPGHGGRDR